ncbi:unnamed protein product [Protopolystoma xenopodis]|uniref:Uncharacterized protein n=1 Tax=Protopolystoma xenopodis TaxID=117903 RepID=A0A3S5AQ12_9PLAT|nr:unnamed protein product [Protopolystoma xenopodis]
MLLMRSLFFIICHNAYQMTQSCHAILDPPVTKQVHRHGILLI